MSPSPPRSLLLENLTPASRRQDHTTSPYASAPFVKGASASTATRPNVRDDGRRPSEWNGIAKFVAVICPSGRFAAGKSPISPMMIALRLARRASNAVAVGDEREKQTCGRSVSGDVRLLGAGYLGPVPQIARGPKSANGRNRSRGRALRRAAWPCQQWMDDGSVLPDDEGPEAYPQNR